MDNSSVGRHLALRLLELETGGRREPAVIADALAAIWQEFCRHLSPLIGSLGFRAIAVRALREAQGEFPVLAGVNLASGADAGLTGLQDAVRGKDPQEVLEALTFLLTAFLSLVLGLLGFDLTRRFLRAAWPAIGCNHDSPVGGK